MFEKIKQKLQANTKPSEAILCIHGFSKKRLKHEYDNFLFWNKKYTFITFDIYDRLNVDDKDSEQWIKRCEAQMEKALSQYDQVSIIGFSMGGVIATHLAANYPTYKLFLLAPAFEYVQFSTVVNQATSLFAKQDDADALPSGFTNCFMEVVKKCKDEISQVTCPICFVHGDEDETVPLRSSLNAYDKAIAQDKKLYILHEGKHQLMLHENTAWDVWQLFNLFMEDQIVTCHKEHTKDIYG